MTVSENTGPKVQQLTEKKFDRKEVEFSPSPPPSASPIHGPTAEN